MKVGDYVRTKDGVIAKITDIIEDFSIDCDRDVFHAFCNWRPDVMEIPWYYKEEYIIKSSPNIIDLIEVGDYVNGEQVSRIKQCPEYHLGDGILIFNEHNETIYSNFRTSKYYDIKSIVTKESMERVTYYVK